jgi:DNA-binding response OmpR family regulator
MLIVDVLEELGFRVLEAADAECGARRQLENTDQVIDLMMTDVGLPGMDGRRLGHPRPRRLRPQLCRSCSPAAMPRGVEVPSRACKSIAKPFSIDQLRDKVKQACSDLQPDVAISIDLSERLDDSNVHTNDLLLRATRILTTAMIGRHSRH